MTRILALAAMLTILSAAGADEPDDVLVRQLSTTVRDPRQSLGTRVTAARMLGKLGPRASAAVPDLAVVLDRLRGIEQEPLQEVVVETLGQIGTTSKAALPSLARASFRSIDIDLAVKKSTDLILAAPDDQDLDALVKQLASRDPSLRLRAIKAIGILGPAAARATVPFLVATLGDPDGDVRRAAITILRQMFPNVRPTEVVIRAIAVDLVDPDPNMRLLAVRALGRIGPPAIIVAPDIDALRNDPDTDVRRAAIDALVKVNAAP
jgi:HEAT repeat protein